MRSTFVLFLLLGAYTLCGQDRELSWGYRFGSSGNDVISGCLATETGVLTFGTFSSSALDMDPSGGSQIINNMGSYDAFFAYYAADESSFFSKHLGGSGEEYINDIATDGSGNIYIGGQFKADDFDLDPSSDTHIIANVGVSYDAFVAKYTPAGDFIWGFRFGGPYSDQVTSLAVDDSNNVYITGSIRDAYVDLDPGPDSTIFLANDAEMYLSKFDSNGVFQWGFAIGGTNNDFGTDVEIDHQNNVIVSGGFRGEDIDFDPDTGVVILSNLSVSQSYYGKYSSSGALLWMNAVEAFGVYVCGDPAGNVYAQGLFSSSNVDFDPGSGVTNLAHSGSTDIYIARYDNTGALDWVGSIGGPNQEISYDLEYTSWNTLMAWGTYRSSGIDFDWSASNSVIPSYDNSADIYVLELSTAADFLNLETISGNSQDHAFAAPAQDNAFYLGGFFYSTSIDLDFTGATFPLNNAGGDDAFLAYYPLVCGTETAVTAHPQNVTVEETNTCSFTVGVVGESLIFEWQEDSGSGYATIPNAAPYVNVNTASMGITTTALGMSGNTYRCLVSGLCGEPVTSEIATLTVTMMPDTTDSVPDTTTFISAVPNDHHITLFPNPAQHEVIITADGPDLEELQVFNAQGVRVKQQRLSHAQRSHVKLDHLPNGVYTFRVLHTNGRESWQPLVISR